MMPTRIEREEIFTPISIQNLVKIRLIVYKLIIICIVKFGANVQTFAQIVQFLEVILRGGPQIVVI